MKYHFKEYFLIHIGCVFVVILVSDVSKHVVSGFKGQLCSDTGPSVQMEGSVSSGEARVICDATLPALHDLDIGVIKSLPPEVFSEINDLYSGELISLISKKKEKTVETSKTVMVPHNIEGNYI